MHDSVLDGVCLRNPRTLIELREVRGFGPHKTETYGPEILTALKQYYQSSPPPSPAPHKDR